MRDLNRRSSKSCGKSPEKYFCWSPLVSIFKRIPIAIFIGTLQLNHFRKRHDLLFCTVYIYILLCQRDLKCRYWVGFRNKIGWLPKWRVSHKCLCGKGIRNKKIFISLHISSIVSKTWGKWFPIVREKYEKIEHFKVKCFLCVFFLECPKSKFPNFEKIHFFA